jgi:hypothetical protein
MAAFTGCFNIVKYRKKLNEGINPEILSTSKSEKFNIVK